MPSNAWKKFDENAGDIDLLIDLYQGTVQLYKDESGAAEEYYEVFFRSAIVLMVSHWEAYIEDICSEALDHLMIHVADPVKLPKEIKKQIAKEIKEAKDEIAIWQLAGEGWKEYVRDRMSNFKKMRDRSFNTPKAYKTAEFIKLTLGLDDIRKAWTFDGKDTTAVGKQLDSLVEIRGEIAHRGRITQNLDADFVAEQTKFLRKVVGKTGGFINTHMKKVTGTPLFSKTG